LHTSPNIPVDCMHPLSLSAQITQAPKPFIVSVHGEAPPKTVGRGGKSSGRLIAIAFERRRYLAEVLIAAAALRVLLLISAANVF
jgi:hypothetical protein